MEKLLNELQNDVKETRRLWHGLVLSAQLQDALAKFDTAWAKVEAFLTGTPVAPRLLPNFLLALFAAQDAANALSELTIHLFVPDTDADCERDIYGTFHKFWAEAETNNVLSLPEWCSWMDPKTRHVLEVVNLGEPLLSAVFRMAVTNWLEQQ